MYGCIGIGRTKIFVTDMCQTALISRNVVRMSKRAYSHRLEVVTPNLYHVSQLARLNRDLDGLYELVYGQWRTVSAEDYKVFGGQFKVLLETIKDLYNACRKAPKELGLQNETRKLGMNYSALYEINSDIVNWNIKAPKNEALKEAMRHLAEVDAKKDAND